MNGRPSRRAQPAGGRARALRAIATWLALVASLPACGWNPPGILTGKSADDDPTPTSAAQALSPRELVISPLTSIRRSESVEDQLVVHLAVQDGFAQPIKALGTLVIELTAPPPRNVGGGGRGGADPDAPPPPLHTDGTSTTARWEIDLRDPEANASAFDGLVSKTYVLRLGGLPGGEAKPESSGGGGGAGRWATVRATFTVVDAGWGETRVLTAEARVGW